MKHALIFDCDGVLTDGEQRFHLRAFNQMWEELGVSWRWSEEEYAQKLKISGGKERLASLYQEAAFRAAVAVPKTAEEWQALVCEWHRRKTQIYLNLIATEGIPPRSGVKRLSEEAVCAGWTLAVASSGSRESVEAVVRHVMGKKLAEHIAVFAGDMVRVKKPAPDLYLLTSRALAVPSWNCLVIEDSRNGLLACCAAHMKCIITPTRLTRDEDFSEADLVISCLGDPESEECHIIQNRCNVSIERYVRLENLLELFGSTVM